MSSRRKSPKKNKIANHIDDLKIQVLSRWRELVRRDREQWRLVHNLDDRELEDHLPALTDKVIKALRGEATEGLDDDAAQHGRQRRALGFSVLPSSVNFRFSVVFSTTCLERLSEKKLPLRKSSTGVKS